MNIYKGMQEYAERQQAKKERKRDWIAFGLCCLISTLGIGVYWALNGFRRSTAFIYLGIVNTVLILHMYAFWCFIRDVIIPHREKIKSFFVNLFEILAGLVGIALVVFLIGWLLNSCPHHTETEHIHFERY